MRSKERRRLKKGGGQRKFYTSAKYKITPDSDDLAKNVKRINEENMKFL